MDDKKIIMMKIIGDNIISNGIISKIIEIFFI